MVQELTVECPHCHQVADIYLSTNACVIILNCPSCTSPIMYFDQKIFILTPNQLEAIKNKAHSSSMMNILKKMIKPQKLSIQKESKPHSFQNAHQSVHAVHQHENSCSVGDTSKIHIGNDDIINMKIDLGMSRDVLEFIEKI